MLALLAGCTSLPLTEPRLLRPPTPWFEGDRQQLDLDWPAATNCHGAEFDCTHGDPPEVRITSVTCDGCRAFTQPSNRIYYGGTYIDFEATTTDLVTVSVGVEAEGERRTLTASGLGDRELALHARCKVVATSVIEGGSYSNQDFRNCRETRQPGDTVIVELAIESAHGKERFPFCPDSARCGPNHERKTSSISVTPPPDRWIFNYPAFSRPEGGTVAVTVALATGELSSANVAIPPLADHEQ